MTWVHGLYLGDDSKKPRVRVRSKSHHGNAVETQDSISTRVSGKLGKGLSEMSLQWMEACVCICAPAPTPHWLQGAFQYFHVHRLSCCICTQAWEFLGFSSAPWKHSGRAVCTTQSRLCFHKAVLSTLAVEKIRVKPGSVTHDSTRVHSSPALALLRSIRPHTNATPQDGAILIGLWPV